MALTNEQREARRKYLGSSEAAAVMGLDPYRSAADVWMSKTGKVDDYEGDADTERGLLLEPAILSWAERKLGVPFVRDQFVTGRCVNLCYNADALIEQRREIVEAKSTVNADEYGDQDTDQVPKRVLVQTHHGMYVCGDSWRVAWVPILVPGFRRFEFRMYRVDRIDELAETIAERGDEFMEKYVQRDIRPDDFRPSLEVLKRTRRTPNKVIEIPDQVVDGLVTARAAMKQAKDDCEDAEAEVLKALGDAEGATYSRGELTYLETHRKGYTVQETTYRSIKVKAAKPAKELVTT